MKQTPYIINLGEPDFKPVGKGRYLEFINSVFPGGEPNFRITSETPFAEDSDLYITVQFTGVENLVGIMLANDASRRLGFRKIHLVMPYFPAARQDRVCNEGESLTVKVFADMINGCGFESVHIFSPHSEVTPALLNNVVVHDELTHVANALKSTVTDHNCNVVNIICPDAGAGKRVGKVVKYLVDRFPYNTYNLKENVFNLIRCEKERDVRDGKLKGFHVSAEDLGGHPTIIIDDIVAYGGTFVGLGEILRARNCGTLMLFVSHADCVAGIENMTKFFDHTFISDSRKNVITQTNLTKYKFTI